MTLGWLPLAGAIFFSFFNNQQFTGSGEIIKPPSVLKIQAMLLVPKAIDSTNCALK